jgi:hypothetical protein
LLSVSFSPLVPDLALYALAGVAALLVALALVSRGPVAILRARAVAPGPPALANPALVQEERDPVKDIVAVVVDRSTSQALGDRPAMTGRVRAELQRRLASMPNVEPRFIEGGDGEGDDGTRLFTALANGLADVPPDRLAGVLMITDGVVHDIRPTPPFSVSARRCTPSSPDDPTSATGRSSSSRLPASASSGATRRSAPRWRSAAAPARRS